MSNYSIELDGDILRIGFVPGQVAGNVRIVQEISDRLSEIFPIQKSNSSLLKIYGSASLPALAAIVSKVNLFYSVIAVWDSTVEKFIVCFSEHSGYEVGELLD